MVRSEINKAGSMPDVDEILDAVLESIVEEMLPEDAWHSRMCEDVGVARLLLAFGERPVLLRAACTMTSM